MLLVGMLLLGYLVFGQLVEREEKQTVRTLDYAAGIQSAAVSAWVEERLRDATVFSQGGFLAEVVRTWIIGGMSDDETRTELLHKLQAIKKSFGYLEVAVVDEAGKAYLSSEGDNGQMLSSAIAHQTVMRAFASGAPVVSTIHSNSSGPQARRVIDIAAPLLQSSVAGPGPRLALLMRSNAAHRLDPFVKAMPLVNTATQVLLAEIIDDRVMSILSSSNAVHFTDFGQLPVEPAALGAAAVSGGELLLYNNPGASVAVVRPVSGTPWYLLAMIDSEATRENIERLAWIVGLSVAGALSLCGLALILWTRERESRYRLHSFQTATEKALLKRRYDYLSRYANDMIILTDGDGRMLEVNDKTLQLLGRERSAVIGQSIEMLFLPECQPILRSALGALRSKGQARFEIAQRGYLGTLLTFEASARALERNHQYIAQFIFRDISERRASEVALRESQERLNSILASIQDVVWSFSPDMSRLNYMNRSVERVFGHPPAAFEQNPRLWLDCVHPLDRAGYEAVLQSMNPDHPFFDQETRIVARDGEVRWLHCRGRLVVDADGQPLRIDGVATDITQRKQAEQQVQTLAYYDSVTHLPNRALLQDRLSKALPVAARTERKVALLFMDLDNFKNINDALGHQIGDHLLRAIAERLLQCVREEDTVARIGGDEFLIVLPDLERAAQCVGVAEKILAACAEPFMLSEHQIHTTISIGISIYPDDAHEVTELVRHADSALYQAKGLGRNTYQFFTPELNYQITRSSEIERRLRHAIDTGALSLWYQPQVDARSGRLVGAEALARWQMGDAGFMSPVEFIPVAEERGLIGKIGEWALREACRQSTEWQAQGLPPVRVAVNVSPIQFQQKGFAELVTGVLTDSGLDARLLELEITESALMRGSGDVVALTARLREIGVGISIDDFGTGYSSLSYLRQIPIDKIKIDRSFVHDMVHDGAIARAIVELAHSLQLRVIAEGVESRAQIERLRAFGCDEVQGHYYSAAVSPGEFARMLADNDTFKHRQVPVLH